MTTIKAGNLKQKHVGKLITIHLEDGVTITDVLEGYSVGAFATIDATEAQHRILVRLKGTQPRRDNSFGPPYFSVDGDSATVIEDDAEQWVPLPEGESQLSVKVGGWL